MSLQYQAFGWNRQKRIYDVVLTGSVVGYLALFAGLGALIHPNATIKTLLIRGFGTAALLLLHIILGIGPLCRLDHRFLAPLQPAASRRDDVPDSARLEEAAHVGLCGIRI